MPGGYKPSPDTAGGTASLKPSVLELAMLGAYSTSLQKPDPFKSACENPKLQKCFHFRPIELGSIGVEHNGQRSHNHCQPCHCPTGMIDFATVMVRLGQNSTQKDFVTRLRVPGATPLDFDALPPAKAPSRRINPSPMPAYMMKLLGAVAGGLTVMSVSSTHKPAATLHFSPEAHGEHVPKLSVKTPGEFSKNGA